MPTNDLAEGRETLLTEDTYYIYTTSIHLFHGDPALPPSSLMFLVFYSYLIGQIHGDGIVYCLGGGGGGGRNDVTVNTKIGHFQVPKTLS